MSFIVDLLYLLSILHLQPFVSDHQCVASRLHLHLAGERLIVVRDVHGLLRRFFANHMLVMTKDEAGYYPVVNYRVLFLNCVLEISESH